MELEAVFQEIIRLCKKHSASQVILFGSRAKGCAGERSDIDLALSGVEDMEGLQEELEKLPTLYSIDLVNLDECKNPLLLEDIKQYGRKIYEAV